MCPKAGGIKIDKKEDIMEKKRKKPWQFGKLALAGVLSAAMVVQPVTGLVTAQAADSVDQTVRLDPGTRRRSTTPTATAWASSKAGVRPCAGGPTGSAIVKS